MNNCERMNLKVAAVVWNFVNWVRPLEIILCRSVHFGKAGTRSTLWGS